MKATIIGNLGRDAELKFTASQEAYLNFSVAETVGYGKNAETQWVNCTIWGKRAESKIAEYLLKGQSVVVFGEAKVRTWQDKQGAERWTLECRVDDIKLTGKKEDKGDAPAQRQSSGSQKSLLDNPPAGGTQPIPFDDDDIPF